MKIIEFIVQQLGVLEVLFWGGWVLLSVWLLRALKPWRWGKRPDYVVAYASNPLQLGANVRRLIAEGWEASGGVSAADDKENGKTIYIQALIKR